MKYVYPILALFLSLLASCKEGEETPEISPFIEISNKSIQFARYIPLSEIPDIQKFFFCLLTESCYTNAYNNFIEDRKSPQ